MGVIMLDYGRSFDLEALHRLAEAGCRDMLLFDAWHRHEPEDGVYELETLIDYARTCRELGMQLRVQTPIGVPSWCPRDWFLQNAEGSRNDFTEVMARYPVDDGVPNFERLITEAQRFLSYWIPEAEAAVHRYVSKLRTVLEPEGAICISSIGICGEYLFPSVCFYGFGPIPPDDSRCVEVSSTDDQNFPRSHADTSLQFDHGPDFRANIFPNCVHSIFGNRLHWRHFLGFCPPLLHSSNATG
ncbi:hypothetical protein SH661x_004328 [Planctomicrobium sp. SH661]|uniref:hypothetical protein n=1 Tax=Planctomicrobium sp. SH661 TaxID=3448124 RepID=UPI003F5C3CC6